MDGLIINEPGRYVDLHKLSKGPTPANEKCQESNANAICYCNQLLYHLPIIRVHIIGI